MGLGDRRGSGSRIRVKALVTERVARALPGCLITSPAGTKAPICAPNIRRAAIRSCLAKAVNTLTTYGYDPATGMQEPKATLCQIRAA